MMARLIAYWVWIFLVAAWAPVSQAAEVKKGTIKMDVLTVQGELQKPQASYIVQRSNRISLSEDLKSKAPPVVPRIVESLQDDVLEPRP